MVYYFCHCMSFHVCLADFFFIFNSRLTTCLGQKRSFWHSPCSILIVVPLLQVRPSLVS